jgi:hypothetical protein
VSQQGVPEQPDPVEVEPTDNSAGAPVDPERVDEEEEVRPE